MPGSSGREHPGGRPQHGEAPARQHATGPAAPHEEPDRAPRRARGHRAIPGSGVRAADRHAHRRRPGPRGRPRGTHRRRGAPGKRVTRPKSRSRGPVQRRGVGSADAVGRSARSRWSRPTSTRTSSATCGESRPSSSGSSRSFSPCSSSRRSPGSAGSADPTPGRLTDRPRQTRLVARRAAGTAPAPLFAPPDRMRPLADRMRPRSLDEVVGQDALLGPGAALRRLVEGGRLPSCILWGPPGSGKTTIGRLLAEAVGARFAALNSTTDGVATLRGVVEEARTAAALEGRTTVVFLDEVHRYSKAQQDSLLPHVEAGTIVLVGATTEPPIAGGITPPLLSRLRVFRLQPLGEGDLATIAARALADPTLGLAGAYALDETAARQLIGYASGDARRMLGLLETAALLAGQRASARERTPPRPTALPAKRPRRNPRGSGRGPVARPVARPDPGRVRRHRARRPVADARLRPLRRHQRADQEHPRLGPGRGALVAGDGPRVRRGPALPGPPARHLGIGGRRERGARRAAAGRGRPHRGREDRRRDERRGPLRPCAGRRVPRPRHPSPRPRVGPSSPRATSCGRTARVRSRDTSGRPRGRTGTRTTPPTGPPGRPISRAAWQVEPSGSRPRPAPRRAWASFTAPGSKRRRRRGGGPASSRGVAPRVGSGSADGRRATALLRPGLLVGRVLPAGLEAGRRPGQPRRFCQTSITRALVEALLSRAPRRSPDRTGSRHRGDQGPVRAWPDHDSRRRCRNPVT